MKRIILIACLLISLSLSGQVPAFEWVISHGGEGPDASRDIVTDKWGNVLIVGSFRNTIDADPGAGYFPLISQGEADAYVAKYTPEGGLIWAFSFGDYENDAGYGIATDTLGSVYITGHYGNDGFEVTIDFDPGPDNYYLTLCGGDDFFILKLTADGSFEWVKKIGGEDGLGQVIPFAIQLDDKGNIYTTGYFRETIDFDPGTAAYNLTSNGNGSWDIFISKLNNNGDFIWAKSMGGELEDWGRSIAVDSAGNIYTTGIFYSSLIDFDPGPDQFNISALGEIDMFISKLNSDGDHVWTKTLGAPLASVLGGSITVDDLGFIYMTGGFEGTVDFDPNADQYTLTSTGQTSVFVLKLNINGEFSWAREIDGEEYAGGNSIVLDKNANLYITGGFDGIFDFDPGVGVFNLSGERDIFILKLDNSGLFHWAVSFSGSNNSFSFGDFGRSITLDQWDNIYTTGVFEDTVDFDSGVGVYESISNGSIDNYIHKMRQQPCTTNTTITSIINGFTICKGDSITLRADLPDDVFVFSYFWNSGNITGSIAISPDTTTTYTVTVNHSPACYSSDTVVVNVLAISDTIYLEATSCDSLDTGLTEFVYADQNGCDSIVIETTTFIPLPETPIAPADLLIQQNEPPFQLMIAEVLGAISYLWQVPAGVQILSGGATNLVTIDWNGLSTSGSVCVAALNECGSSPATCMQVTVDIPNGFEQLEPKGFTIFPNPANEVLNIVFSDGGVYEIVLLDALGRKVIPAVACFDSFQLGTSKLPDGIYWLKIKKEDDLYIERIEIVR